MKKQQIVNKNNLTITYQVVVQNDEYLFAVGTDNGVVKLRELKDYSTLSSYGNIFKEDQLEAAVKLAKAVNGKVVKVSRHVIETTDIEEVN